MDRPRLKNPGQKAAGHGRRGAHIRIYLPKEAAPSKRSCLFAGGHRGMGGIVRQTVSPELSGQPAGGGCSVRPVAPVVLSFGYRRCRRVRLSLSDRQRKMNMFKGGQAVIPSVKIPRLNRPRRHPFIEPVLMPFQKPFQRCIAEAGPHWLAAGSRHRHHVLHPSDRRRKQSLTGIIEQERAAVRG